MKHHQRPLMVFDNRPEDRIDTKSESKTMQQACWSAAVAVQTSQK